MMTDLVLAAMASLGRMFSAYILSVFTALILGSAMAKNRLVESVLLPILDILQSIPILGFFPAALLFFVTYLPARIGIELASIFLIWTSLVWNMIFGVYSSVKSLDPSYEDLARIYSFGHAARFFFIYTPASRSSLIANSLVSWAGGWFFLTSAEVVSLGNAEYKLTGLGSFIIESFNGGDFLGFYVGVSVLLAIITLTYFILWNPAVSKNLGLKIPGFAEAYERIHELVGIIWRSLSEFLISLEAKILPFGKVLKNAFKLALLLVLLLIFLEAGFAIINVNIPNLIGRVLGTFVEVPLSLTRIAFIIVFSLALSLIVSYVSYRSLLAEKTLSIAGELLASIPAIIWWPLLSNIALRYPFGASLVSMIVFLQGSFWYLYFNILVYGLTSIKKEFEELSSVYKIHGLNFFRYVFVPSVLPSVATGALSAWGGAWNASVVAEYVQIEDRSIDLGGVGALLNRLTVKGDAEGLLVAALTLSLIIVVINKTLWSRFFKYIEGKYGGEQ